MQFTKNLLHLLKFTVMSTSIISKQPKGEQWYPGFLTVKSLTEPCNSSVGSESECDCNSCVCVCCPVALVFDIVTCPFGSGKWFIEQCCNWCKRKKKVTVTITPANVVA